MKRREFLRVAGVGAAGLLLGSACDLEAGGGQAASASAGTARPNIVLILADDLGYAGLTCQGGDTPTPSIDSIARNGVRATAGYVTCPVCAPTRAGLLTGRYQQRFGFETNPGGGGRNQVGRALPGSEKIIPEYLKEAGYATGMFGKWHLGSVEGTRPTERGFDEFFGFLGGAHSYYPSVKKMADPIMRGTTPVEENGYLTQALQREALAFIDKHKKGPFFMYLPFNAVHKPLEAPKEYLDRFGSIRDETRRTHAAMLAVLDEAVGAVLGSLRQHGLERNTLVVFLSDNGGPTQGTTASNAPLNGQKATMYEGGIRIPFLVQWKGHLPAGKIYASPVSALDLLPTMLAAAGLKTPGEIKLDGLDLVPYFNDRNRAAPHSDLFWRMDQKWAVRSGDWKLVQPDKRTGLRLYNLIQDIGEKNNLLKKETRRVKELQAKYDTWAAQMHDPLWVK